MKQNTSVTTKETLPSSRTDEQHQFWTARAKDYEKLDWVRKQSFLDAMIKFCELRNDWHVLDVGSGPGVIAAAVKPYVQKVTGVDITPEMVEKALENHADKTNIDFVEGDVEDLQFTDDTFDLATARMVFHHVNDCQQGLSEILRTLKPNGWCVVCEGVPPDHLTRQRYEEIFVLKEKRHTFSEAELVNLFDFAGFEDITLKPYFMRRVSLNNWLNNASLPETTIMKIRRLHIEADSHFKKVYRLEERGDDVIMDWKFVLIKGRKPEI